MVSGQRKMPCAWTPVTTQARNASWFPWELYLPTQHGISEKGINRTKTLVDSKRTLTSPAHHACQLEEGQIRVPANALPMASTMHHGKSPIGWKMETWPCHPTRADGKLLVSKQHAGSATCLCAFWSWPDVFLCSSCLCLWANDPAAAA
jgi:hypothetical protein